MPASFAPTTQSVTLTRGEGPPPARRGPILRARVERWGAVPSARPVTAARRAPRAGRGGAGRAGGEGGGRDRAAEELAAGLKAAVSWQPGQASVSALRLRSGHLRSGRRSMGVLRVPDGLCPPRRFPADLPAPQPPPFPPLGRRTPGAGGRL